MTYGYEEFGNGVAVPCVWLDLSGSNGPQAGSELKDRIFEIVDREGALLFRGAGIDGPAGYAAFLTSIGFRHHSYVGGTAPRTDLGRGVYTATDLPPDTTVMIHQEMSYLDDVPDYVSFYSHEPPENGQRTHLIGDMRRLSAQLPDELRRKYHGRRARLRRVLKPEGSDAVVARREKSWQEVLGTGDRREAQAIAERKGWDLTWKDDGSLIFLQEPARFFRPHPVHGEMWCSQGLHYQPAGRRLVAERDGRMEDALRIATAMAEAPDSLAAMVMEDGSPVPAEDCAAWFHLCSGAQVSYALGRGEMIVLDNMLMAHGRTTFTGTRTMYAALGDRAR
jgi:hypothetical protein